MLYKVLNLFLVALLLFGFARFLGNSYLLILSGIFLISSMLRFVKPIKEIVIPIELGLIIFIYSSNYWLPNKLLLRFESEVALLLFLTIIGFGIYRIYSFLKITNKKSTIKKILTYLILVLTVTTFSFIFLKPHCNKFIGSYVEGSQYWEERNGDICKKRWF